MKLIAKFAKKSKPEDEGQEVVASVVDVDDKGGFLARKNAPLPDLRLQRDGSFQFAS